MALKRYLVFAGDNYYPGGGWEDFIADFDSLDDARKHLLTRSMDWYQIIDTENKDQEVKWLR